MACTGIIMVALVQPIQGQMGPGMMSNQGYNYSYGPGTRMGSGMMGYSGYNSSYGPGMTSNMMMGNMMAIYYPESKPITQDEALKNMQNFTTQYGPNVKIEDFMAFSSNYYAVLNDTSSNQDIAEILVDRYSGSTFLSQGQI